LEDSDDYGWPYVPKKKKKPKNSQPSQLSVESTDGSEGGYKAKRKNKPKKPAPFLREDTDNDVLDISGDGTDNDIIIVRKPAKKRKPARSDDVQLKQRKKNVKKREQAPTNITPLILTCEIELGPTTLAAIA
jgi:hypothetical protein